MSYRPFPEGVTVGPSFVHGLGLVTESDFAEGHEFGIAHVAHEDFEDGYIRTPLGGLINHSGTPNCEIYDDGDYRRLRGVETIGAGSELTIQYKLYEFVAPVCKERVLDKKMKLGKYFTLGEGTASNTAARLGIPNMPDDEQLANMKRTVRTLMDPIREEFGAIRVTSFLRVTALNAHIKGSSKTSYHQHGLAVDFRPYADVPLKQVMDWVIASNLPHDQIIYEYANWLHIGAAKDGREPRKQALMKFSDEGYKTYDPDDSRVV